MLRGFREHAKVIMPLPAIVYSGGCCHEHCVLCSDPSEGMSTKWYATVAFQGLTTTCLGHDYYMLHVKQVLDEAKKYSELQGQCMDQY